ncbi:MAG: CocE/NonD family hydrolase [Gammaproteobacteria bacterium]|nr:CocE/NonD family hydrolase [Rhodospirillaceae bacterium]MDE0365142.1 CocE/NonD family hydrolase [Gammaproteobacteria bacterium]
MKKQTLKIPMRDGTHLETDLFLPDAEARFPALLMRHPYGRLYSDSVYESMTDDGYAVLFQNDRGRFGSEGKWWPLHETSIRDGADSVDWIASQPWCDGNVGLFGSSYAGVTQWHTAMAAPESLRAMAPVVAGSIQDYFPFVSPGVWALGTLMGWTLNVANHEADKLGLSSDNHEIRGFMDLNRKLMETTDMGSDADMEALVKAAAQVPPAFEKLLNDHPLADFAPSVQGFAPWVDEWLAHPDPADDYWQAVDWSRRYADIDTPAFIVAGWHDLFITSAFRDFSGLNGRIANRVKLIVHPGSHTMGLAPSGYMRVGERLFRMSAVEGPWEGLVPGNPGGLSKGLRDWFERWLKGKPDADASAPIRLYVMGADEWRDEWEWPLARTRWTRFHLHSQGQANSLNGDGRLSTDAPVEEPPDHFEYDPTDPVPTIGGRGLLPVAAGVFDHAELEKRPDILVYSTDPLNEDVEVTGPVVLNLWVATSAVDTDFTARLLDVFPDGVAYNLTDGVTRLRFRPDKPGPVVPGEVEQVEIVLAPTSNLFQRGHRIRLEVSSSNFPFADPNPNTGKCLLSDAANETIVAQQTVFHDSQRPSHLVLPVIPAG